MTSELAVIIMAAGKGTRMNNPDIAKVMYEINGKPLVEYVVDLALRLDSSNVVVIVGWKKESIISHLDKFKPRVICVAQEPQLGTGHAVMKAGPALEQFDGDILVLSGDVPLLTYETMNRLVQHHRVSGAVASVLTAELDNPAGYGRILRDDAEDVIGIVEEKDATPTQRAIREINSGIYVFDAMTLFESLTQIHPSNIQKEYYLTDVFERLWEGKKKVSAIKVHDHREIRGINTPAQLEEARALLAGRRSLTI